MVLLIASTYPSPVPLLIVLSVGLVVGVFGHIINSRLVILTGITLIGLVSAYFFYFSFILQHNAS